jgi:PAS domain S-box-containing protein
VITHIQDITKRVVAENRLKDQEEKFRAVYENINDAIMMVDIENGRYVDCNQMMLDLTGFTRDEICAMKAGELLARPGSSVVPLNIEKIRTLGKLRGESEIISKNGVSIPVEYATSLITIGTAQFMVSVIRDITEQKKVEKILKRDKATFERLVEERTRELSEIRINLERSKRLSDIGTLGAIIAHELRNPLSAIRMATHNIRRKAKNPDLDRHLAGIETKIIESDQIIENLLFYTRLKPPQYDRVPIFDLIENIVESITEKCQDKISINKNIEKLKGLFVECDPTQIKEVIINILNNAMDALVHKEGEIKVSAENQDNHVEIVVKDNGVGIDKNVLKKVYDPFFTTKVKGTGLGLLVVRQVLEFHGGSVNIESEPGMGTSVNVQIPKKRINGCQASL